MAACFVMTAFASEPELIVETKVKDASVYETTVGDTIEISVLVRRTDAYESYLLYGIQDEIEYDTELLTFLPDEVSLWYGFQQGYRGEKDSSLARILINYVDMSGQGVTREDSFVAAKLKFRAKAAGDVRIENKNLIATNEKGEKRAVSGADLYLTIREKNSSGGTTGGNGASGTTGASGATGGVVAGGSGGSALNGQGGNTGSQNAPVQLPETDEKKEEGNQFFYLDVKQDAWYYPAVCFVSEKGYFSGMDKGVFSPDISMTRAMFVTVLYRMAGMPEVHAENMNFSDVVQGSWYENAVSWAAGAKLVNGVKGAFLPDQAITREQIAVILARYIRESGYSVSDTETGTETFSDAAQISSWAYEDVLWMKKYGFIHGMNENRFAPQTLATRAQAAQILMNIAQKIQK